MIIFRPDPDDPKSINRRTLVIIVLLIIAAGLASMYGLQNDTDRLVQKRAEEICGEGNVKSIVGVEITCKAAGESE
ncbi:MAG: hypothetical protein AAGA69_11280 [Pseudomonadota bacterium]